MDGENISERIITLFTTEVFQMETGKTCRRMKRMCSTTHTQKITAIIQLRSYIRNAICIEHLPVCVYLQASYTYIRIFN